MPQGEGTYGTTKGRPPKKNKTDRITKRRDKAYSKAADKSVKKGADTPFDMGVGTDTRSYKKAKRLTGKLNKQPNPDKTFKKQIRQEAKDKFKAGQVIKKHKFKKAKKEQYSKDYETGSYQ